MDKRTDWRSGNELSLLGFGCMRLPKLGPERNNIDWEKSYRLVEHCLERGITYFDTAYYYHDGVSEPVLGEVLSRHPRGSYFLADKLPLWLVKGLSHAKEVFREQLERCRVEYFDYYLCHGLGKSEKEFAEGYLESGIFDHLLALKKEGRIKNFGFSFHGSARVMRYLLDQYDWDFAQMQINYLDWEVQDASSVYALLEAKELPCMVMEPLRGGSLATLPEEPAAVLRQASPDKSLASWGMRFAASLPGVVTVLSGMTTPEQVDDNIATMSPFVPLGDAERGVLADAAEKYLAQGAVPCTGCAYCMDCPAGVDIPGMFHALNENSVSLALPVSHAPLYAFNRHAPAFLAAYEAFPPERRAEACIACGVCVDKCPQRINIPERMKKVADIAEALKKA